MSDSAQVHGKTIAEVGEFELIALLLDALGPQPVEVGLGAEVRLAAGDDCAALAPAPGALTLQTTDTMVQEVHFLPQQPPEALGWKSLASNISDVAAMGGLPTTALVTVGAPGSLSLDWLLAWYRGMAECAARYNVAIAGGDVVRARQDVVITVSLAGEVEPERLAPRTAAAPGDVIIVTGTPGDSAAGLALYQAGCTVPTRLWDAHLRPEPRVPEARQVVQAVRVGAMLDLSDGTGGDLQHVCKGSGVGAQIEEARLPLSRELLEVSEMLGADPLQWALTGGEDYELLICVRPEAAPAALEAIAAAGRTTGTIIGRIVPVDRGVTLLDRQGMVRPLPTSFRHF